MHADPDRCYRAVASRDARFDGRFVTAVTTTGIYCRPSCPAQTPKSAASVACLRASGTLNSPRRKTMPLTLRSISTWFMGGFFIIAGSYHLINPTPYLAMMPPYLPWPAALVVISGVAEIAGGIGLCIARLRLPAAWGLIALLVAVFPANLQVAMHGWPGLDLPRWIL